VAVEVGEAFGIVAHHRVQIQRLRIRQVRVGNWFRHRRPVRAQPAAKAPGVIARAEVVVLRLRVAFLALELVGIRASVDVRAFAAVSSYAGFQIFPNPQDTDATGAHHDCDIIQVVGASLHNYYYLAKEDSENQRHRYD
jgi:hypothetical protein